MTQCPCGSSKNYQDCCGLFIETDKNADTPESLMRSRYTAYTLANMAYIKKTMRGKPLDGFNEAEAETWAKQDEWAGLEVLKSSMEDSNADIGYVEFIASYKDQGKKQSIHELSKFQRIEGKWFYTSGSQPKTKSPKPKISRNAPCPCGSQKKYKNCHGKV